MRFVERLRYTRVGIGEESRREHSNCEIRIEDAASFSTEVQAKQDDDVGLQARVIGRPSGHVVDDSVEPLVLRQALFLERDEVSVRDACSVRGHERTLPWRESQWTVESRLVPSKNIQRYPTKSPWAYRRHRLTLDLSTASMIQLPAMNDDRKFQKEFYQALTDEPITDPTDKTYVRLYDDPAFAPLDPVEQLAKAIEFTTGNSVQLLSGYRGTGKTTELHRLKTRLSADQYKIVHVDMEKYLNMATPVDVTDFLLAIACAFSDELEKAFLLDKDPRRETVFAPIIHFFTKTDIKIPEFSVGGVKAYLKSDESFRSKLHGRMAEHLETLVGELRNFLQQCKQALQQRWGQYIEVVLLVDSIEHLHGNYENSKQVQDSVNTLFNVHAERLRLPYVHVVYTMPPYLAVLAPNVGQNYGTQAVQIFPAVKVQERDGQPHQAGVRALRRLIEERAKKCGGWRRLFETQEQFDHVIHKSGGNIRGLLRMLRQIILAAKSIPVSDETVQLALNQLCMEFLPIANDDARWLSAIARTHTVDLPETDKLPHLARFFQSHLVLCYPNGPMWYDVHPLVRELILKQADEREQLE